MQKLLRIALVASGCLAIASVIVRFALEPASHARRQSKDLTVSFVGYSNGMAILELKSRAKAPVQLAYGYIETQFRKTDGATFDGDAYRVTSTDLLAAGAISRESVPRPTNQLCWRATVAAFDACEISRKRAIEPSWIWQHKPRWLRKEYPKLRYVYADTDWILP